MAAWPWGVIKRIMVALISLVCIHHFFCGAFERHLDTLVAFGCALNFVFVDIYLNVFEVNAFFFITTLFFNISITAQSRLGFLIFL